MPLALANLGALLLSLAILVAGNGLQGTLLAVRANFEGFSHASIGLLQSSYYVGFTASCLVGALVVARAGHIRTFAALASIASVTGLAHALLVEPVTWWVLRAVTGFCFAGLFIVTESWLNERSTNENRGRVLSVYFVVNLSATTAGQLLLPLADPRGFVLFAVVSMLISISLVPVTLTTAAAPAPIQAARLHFRRLYEAAPLGVIACLAVGLANGAFWGLAPVFAMDAGLSVGGVAAFMSLFVVGGALSQWPVGRLSDRLDRRRVLTAAGLLSAVCGLALAFSGAALPRGLLPLAALYGAAVLPLYSLSVAHVNDFTDPRDFVETSGGLLLIFGIGAIAGPVLAAAAMEFFGAGALFLFTAAIHALLGLFGIYRIARRAPVPVEAQEPLVAVPRSTPAVFDLHPAAGPEAGGGGDFEKAGG